MGSGFDYRSTAVRALQRSRVKPDLLGLLHWLRALRHGPSGLHRSLVVATWKPAQRVVVGDAGRDMGSRGMLRRGHIFELEILLYGAAVLFRRHYYLLNLRSLDRWKAIGSSLIMPTPRVVVHALAKTLRSRFHRRFDGREAFSPKVPSGYEIEKNSCDSADGASPANKEAQHLVLLGKIQPSQSAASAISITNSQSWARYCEY